MLLASRELIATELTVPLIEDAFASSGEPVIEAAAGLFLIHVCGPEQSAALVSRAERASWNAAKVNADRNVDRAIRDAEVLDERANEALTEEIRELLFIATRDLAAELVPGAVLAALA